MSTQTKTKTETKTKATAKAGDAPASVSPPEFEEVSFDNVILLRVRVFLPTMSKKDQSLTDKLCAELQAQGVRVNKDLFKLTDVKTYVDAARRHLREECVPWSSHRVDQSGAKKQDSLWAQSGREIKKTVAVLQDLKEKFEAAAKSKVDNYTALVEEQRKLQGGAFDPADYPTKEEFAESFVWETEVMPLRDVADEETDFRLKLPKKIAEEQIRRYRRDVERKVGNVVKDVMHRLAEQLVGKEDDQAKKGLIPRLTEYSPDAEDKRVGNTFRDKRLYDNIDDFRVWVDKIREAIHSEELNELSERLRVFCEDIRPKDPELVRTDDAVRKRVIQGLRGLMRPEEMPEDASPKVAGDGSGFDQFS